MKKVLLSMIIIMWTPVLLAQSSGFDPAELVISEELLWNQFVCEIDKGDFKYCLYDKGVIILENRDTNLPEFVARIPVPNRCINMYMKNNYLTIVTTSGKIYIYDIVDPYNPLYMSMVRLPGGVDHYERIGEYIIASVPGEGIFSVRISLPTSPEITDNLTGDYEKFSVYDRFVYIPDEDLKIYTLGKDGRFSLAGKYTPDLNFNSNSFFIYRHYAYCECKDQNSHSRGYIIDLSDPVRPRFAGGISFFDFFYDPVIVENYLVTEGNVYDLTDPLNPQEKELNRNDLIKAPDPDCPGAGLNFAHGRVSEVTSGDNFVAVSMRNNSVILLDTSDEDVPVFASKFKCGTSIFDLAVKGDYLIISNKESMVYTYDISDIYDPKFVKSLLVDEEFTGMYLNRIYLSNTTMYLWNKWEVYFVDISDPADIRNIGSYELPYYTNNNTSMAGTDSYLYLPYEKEGLYIVDTSDKNSPYLVKILDYNGSIEFESVAVSGNILYATMIIDAGFFMHCYDITNGADPLLVGTHFLPGAKIDHFDKYLSVNGSIVVVHDILSGLMFYEMADPSDPVYLGNADTGGLINESCFAGENIYVADWFFLTVLGKNERESLPEWEIGISGSPRLHQNFPNPFNPMTTIRFELVSASPVTLTIYNMLGQTVKTLAYSVVPAGVHELRWDGTNGAGVSVAAGMYIYRLKAAGVVKIKKMLLLR